MSSSPHASPNQANKLGSRFFYPISVFFLYVALLALVWWVISGGAVGSWLIGAPLVLIAAYLSAKLKTKQTERLRLLPMIKFISFFLYESLRGGVDVARRVYSPTLPLAPALLSYPLRLPEGPAQVFFANIVSLLPGTLSVGINSNTLHLHALDETASVMEDMQALEQKVATVFGVELSNTERTHEES